MALERSFHLNLSLFDNFAFLYNHQHLLCPQQYSSLRSENTFHLLFGSKNVQNDILNDQFGTKMVNFGRKRSKKTDLGKKWSIWVKKGIVRPKIVHFPLTK